LFGVAGNGTSRYVAVGENGVAVHAPTGTANVILNPITYQAI
jgi:hypothetical protein